MSTSRKISNLKIPGMSQIVPVLAVLMEVSWAFIALVWISQIQSLHWESPPLNLPSSLLLAVVTEILVRLSLKGKWSLRRVRGVVIPSTLLLMLLLVRLNLGGGYTLWDSHWAGYALKHLSAIITALVFGIYLIWRGISVGRENGSFSDLYRRFLIGLGGIILVLIFWGVAGGRRGNFWNTAGIEVLLFFGAGLLAMAIANLETIRNELLQHQEATSSFSRRWLSMLIVLVLIILGLAIFGVSIFSSDAGGAIVHLLSILGNWLVTAIVYLLYPIGFVAEGLYYVLRYLIYLLTGGKPPPPLTMPSVGNLPKVTEGQSPVPIPEAVILTLKWGSVVVAIGLIIFFLARLLTRYWEGKPEEGIEEVHESLWSWKIFSMDLRAVLVWLFRWARRRRKPPLKAPPAATINPALDKDPYRIFNIREIYRALLWEGRQAGSPRRATETPYEYSRRLKEHREAIAEELDTLTEVYITERYGQVNPEPEKVAWINRLWRSLLAKFTRPDSDL